MPTWNPGQYLKFADHRVRPAVDLLAQIPLQSPSTVYDLGCGRGSITRLPAEPPQRPHDTWDRGRRRGGRRHGCDRERGQETRRGSVEQPWRELDRRESGKHE